MVPIDPNGNAQWPLVPTSSWTTVSQATKGKKKSEAITSDARRWLRRDADWRRGCGWRYGRPAAASGARSADVRRGRSSSPRPWRAASSHHRRCLLERGERVGSESQPCSSKAAVYEDSSCLARNRWRWSQTCACTCCMCMCMHMHIVMCGRAPRGPTCC